MQLPHDNSPATEDDLGPGLDNLVLATADDLSADALSLVLTATRIPHRIAFHPAQGYQLFVSGVDALKAKMELDTYLEENRNWPVSPPPPDHYEPQFKAMAMLLIGGLMLFYNVTGSWQEQSPWFMAGAGDSRAILEQGQIFRLITSLTLHADLVHLLSNSLIGFFLLHFFLHHLGNGVGLALLLTAAGAANLINVLLHGPGHHFVGFSTAVFAIIGTFCTIGFVSKTKRYFAQIFMPVMAGLSLLAMLGSSGERTDLGAHLCGLVMGLLVGNIVLAPGFDSCRKSIALQMLLGVGSLLAIFTAWYFALTARF